jgi:hypothetical protein
VEKLPRFINCTGYPRKKENYKGRREKRRKQIRNRSTKGRKKKET